MKLLTLILFLLASISILRGQKSDFDCSQITPKTKFSADSASHNLSFLIDKKKGVGRITDSKTDIEIRYYYMPTSSDKRLTIINCKEGILKGKRIDYWLWEDIKKSTIDIVRTIELNPINSWGHFFDSLQVLGFYSFPTMESIRPKMKRFNASGKEIIHHGIADGVNYIFEIKIGNSTRSFSYHSPETWYKTYGNVDELRQATEIIQFFENSFKEGNSR